MKQDIVYRDDTVIMIHRGGGVFVEQGTFTLNSPSTTADIHRNTLQQVYKDSGGTDIRHRRSYRVHKMDKNTEN